MTDSTLSIVTIAMQVAVLVLQLFALWAEKS
jgi:hypothetical protein